MEEKILKATHQGKVIIGERELNCAVLEDGTRILSKAAIFMAFGRTKRGRMKNEIRVPNMPSFIDAKNLQPFISEDLSMVLTNPIVYLTKNGKEAEGFKAEILPLLCDVYLTARDNSALTPSQQMLVIASDILVRSLSKVAILSKISLSKKIGYLYG